MTKPSNDGNIVKRTSQYIDNLSFDEPTGVRGMAIYGSPDGTNVYRAQVDANGNLKVAADLKPGVDYDYLDVQQTDSDTETYVFKIGGSGGTTVRTIVVNYTSSAKTDIDNVSWS